MAGVAGEDGEVVVLEQRDGVLKSMSSAVRCADATQDRPLVSSGAIRVGGPQDGHALTLHR